MSGGFPDPEIRKVQIAGRWHIQVGQAHDEWATICTREREAAARGVRDAIGRAMGNHHDLRYAEGTVEEDVDDAPAEGDTGTFYEECTCGKQTEPIPVMHDEGCPIRAHAPGPFPPATREEVPDDEDDRFEAASNPGDDPDHDPEGT